MLVSRNTAGLILLVRHDHVMLMFLTVWFRHAHSSDQESHGTCIIEACGLEPHVGRVVSLVCGNVAVVVEVVVALLLDDIKGLSVSGSVVGSLVGGVTLCSIHECDRTHSDLDPGESHTCY